MVCVFMFAYSGKEITDSGGRVGAIEFLDRLAIFPTNSNPVPLAANINGNVELCLHGRPLSYNAARRNRLRALPTQEPHLLASSRQALQTMRMTGAAFQAEPILANPAGPLSHTPVSAHRTPHDRHLHLAI